MKTSEEERGILRHPPKHLILPLYNPHSLHRAHSLVCHPIYTHERRGQDQYLHGMKAGDGPRLDWSGAREGERAEEYVELLLDILGG